MDLEEDDGKVDVERVLFPDSPNLALTLTDWRMKNREKNELRDYFSDLNDMVYGANGIKIWKRSEKKILDKVKTREALAREIRCFPKFEEVKYRIIQDYKNGLLEVEIFIGYSINSKSRGVRWVPRSFSISSRIGSFADKMEEELERTHLRMTQSGEKRREEDDYYIKWKNDYFFKH